MEGSSGQIWNEPVRGYYTELQDFLTKSGLDLLQGFFNGNRLPPPIHYLTGLTFTSAAPGTATFTMPVTNWLLSPQGVVSGSTLSLLVDGPLGCAVQTANPPATPYTTAEMSLSYIRPVFPGTTLTGVGRIIHSGRIVGLADVTVTDSEGRVVAVGSTRCVALPRLEIAADSVPAPVRQVEPDWPTPHPFEREALGETLPPDIWEVRSGLDILRAHIAGELPAPPIAHLCGVRPVHAEQGTTKWTMPATEWLCSPVRGRLYGGAIAYLAGTALDGAVQSVVRAGTGFAPVDLKVYFLRPVAPDGQDLVATGTVMHRGRTIAVAASEVHDADGKIVATAVGSAMLLPGRPLFFAAGPDSQS